MKVFDGNFFQTNVHQKGFFTINEKLSRESMVHFRQFFDKLINYSF